MTARRPLVAQTLRPELHPLLVQLAGDGLIDAVEVVPDGHLVSPQTRRRLTAWLEELRLPYSFHFTELQPGGPDFRTRIDLQQIRGRLEGFSPVMISAHLSAGHVGTFNYKGNLACVHDEDTLAMVCEHLDDMVAGIGDVASIAIENIPCQFDYAASTLSPEDFVLGVLERSSVGMLLDLCNLYVHARNRGLDVPAFLRRIPSDRVVEIHLAGGEEFPESGEYCDTHSAPVPPEVFGYLELALTRFSPALIVIEREQSFHTPAQWKADLQTVHRMLA